MVRYCDRVRDVMPAVRSCPAQMLITECIDRDGSSTIPAVESVRGGYPTVSVIVYAIPGRTPSSDILTMARLGVHELVMRGFDDVGIAFRAAMESAVRGCAATRVVAGLRDHVPVNVLPFLRYCLDRAAFEPSVAEAAEFLGVHRKTLVYRLRQAGMPSPSAVVSWCRLFVAAHLLESPQMSVADVTLRLDFASASAFRGMLRRHTGLRPQELRAHGGLNHLLHLFRQTINSTPETHKETA